MEVPSDSQRSLVVFRLLRKVNTGSYFVQLVLHITCSRDYLVVLSKQSFGNLRNIRTKIHCCRHGQIDTYVSQSSQIWQIPGIHSTRSPCIALSVDERTLPDNLLHVREKIHLRYLDAPL